jgi:hypothetical protein
MPLIGGDSHLNVYFFEKTRRSFLVQNEEEPNIPSNRAARHEDHLPSHGVTPRAKLEGARPVSTDHEEGPSEEAEAPSVQVPFQTIPSVKLLATHRTEREVDVQGLTVLTEENFKDEDLLFAASEERRGDLAELDIQERGREPLSEKERGTEEAARKAQAERRPETGEEKSEQTWAVEKEAEVALEEVAKAIERLDKLQVDLQVHGWGSRTESMFRSESDAADGAKSGHADSEQGAQKDSFEPAGKRISDEEQVKKKKKKKKGESSNRRFTVGRSRDHHQSWFTVRWKQPDLVMRLLPTRAQRRFAAICHGAGLLAILFIYQMSNSRLSPENANSQVSLGIRYTGYLQLGATLQDDSVLLTVVWG